MKISLLKKIKSFLLVFMILISCLPASSGFAAGSVNAPEMPQNCTSSAEFVIESVIETAPMNPDFLESWKLSSIESFSFRSKYEKISGTGYKPSPVKLSGLASSEGRVLLRASGSELPPVYDLRKERKVTAVKDQGKDGSCWAFSSIASLESYILGKEGKNYDFSENNMKNLASKNYPEGFDFTSDEGGNAFMSTAYLSRWDGPVNEFDDPYSESSTYSPAGLQVQRHVQEVLFLPEKTEPLDNEVLKRALLEYGAVYSTMYWNPGHYQEKNYTYRYTKDLPVNHAVTIVGWDDSFDKNLFMQVPPGDGAFIVKNSWGDVWGQEGYFYISYYDTKLGYNENAVFTAEDLDNYDNIYQYDPLGWVVSKKYSENPLVAWGGNVYSSEKNETLRAVGFYTTDLNTAYEIYIYKNPVSGPVNSRKGFIVQESGRYTFPGYHTHVLNSAVPIHAGERFSIVIRFINPSASGPLAVEEPLAYYSSKARANPGESYVSPNGVRWEDISSKSKANLCIKAFTTSNDFPDADFSSNTTSGMRPLTVQFTDLSNNAFSWKWDMNGDGETDSTVQNPVYTYRSYGNYTVSLTIGNGKGFDSKTKHGYITVTPLSINSADPRRNITGYIGEKQEFSVSTNYACNVSWYFNGENRGSESQVKKSSYSESIQSPGTYNITAIARIGDEEVTQKWEWTVRTWNPWDSPASHEGKKISTKEIQEAIHIYRNGLQIPETGAELTKERLKELIILWREGSED